MERVDVRPRLRGHLHALSFVTAIPAGAILIAAADRPGARLVATLYVASLLAVFGASASYHVLARSARTREILQRVDHAMIYLLIAGTYTPVCLLALPRSWGVPLLSVVVAGGLVGAVVKLTAFRTIGPYASGLYLVLGWIAVAAAPTLAREMGDGELLLLVLGGLAYTVGFPVLMLKRPDPWPRVFGYHEIWHVFTVVAAVLHFGMVASLVR